MRILHIDTGREMRGGQHQVVTLYRELDALGCEQLVLGGSALRSLHGFEAASWRSVRRHAGRCDLLHAHDARAHTLAVLHGRGRPLVVARRVAFPIRRGPGSAWKYRVPARFIAISDHVAGVLAAGGVPRDKTVVVHDAAPGDALLSRRTQRDCVPTSARPGEFRVVSPATADPLKGRDLAIEACRLAGAALVLSDDLPRDLRRADALLYLSRSEGLGSGILLAMLAGVPTVASRVGGIPEVVQHRRTGLLVKNEPRKIAAALRRLAGDSRLRTAMGRQARSRVLAEFNPRRMALRTAAVYSDVLGGPVLPHKGAQLR